MFLSPGCHEFHQRLGYRPCLFNAVTYCPPHYLLVAEPSCLHVHEAGGDWREVARITLEELGLGAGGGGARGGGARGGGVRGGGARGDSVRCISYSNKHGGVLIVCAGDAAPTVSSLHAYKVNVLVPLPTY